jgi:hypothetical protein
MDSRGNFQKRDYVPRIAAFDSRGVGCIERSQDGEIFRNYDNAVRVPAKCVAIANNFQNAMCFIRRDGGVQVFQFTQSLYCRPLPALKPDDAFVAAVTLAVAAWR